MTTTDPNTIAAMLTASGIPAWGGREGEREREREREMHCDTLHVHTLLLQQTY